MAEYDVAVDFMDMTNDRHLWALLEDARPGFVPIAGRYVVVGCEDADPAVANPYANGLPDDVQQQLARRYADVFRVFLKHSDAVQRRVAPGPAGTGLSASDSSGCPS